MKVSLNWLSQYMDVSSIRKDLKGSLHQLTMRGLEVESVQDLAAGFDLVVVAQVIEKNQHPNATKLSLCKVSDGKETLQIVCGAQNFKAGDKVALSKIGANLPNGLKIQLGKIRDVESYGMLCSEEELGIKEKAEGILILPQDAKLGTPLAEFLGRNDVVFEINVTPNRGDALSHIGVAREFCSITGQKLKLPVTKFVEEKVASIAKVKVEIVDQASCKQFHARVIENVKVGPSPAWLVQYLEAVGSRSISNLVDITNFVMLEYGTPLHAYDFDRLQGEGSHKIIRARKAAPGEKIKLLDDTVAELNAEDLVIADAKVPVGLAGVMGGGDSEVSGATKNILLEAAEFSYQAVRKSSKRHQKHTDASHRYERQLNPLAVAEAMERATGLIAEICGGKVLEGKVSAYQKGYEDVLASLRDGRKKISVNIKELNNFLGIEVKTEEAKSLLDKAGFRSEKSDEGTLLVSVEPHRSDVTIAEDVYEEVLRIWGYEKVVPVIPQLSKSLEGAGSNNSPSITRHRFIDKLKVTLGSLGFSECVNFAFTSHDRAKAWTYVSADVEKLVKLQNPLNEEFTTLKTSLLGGLFQNILSGFNHQQSEMRFFEVRPVYYRDEKSETGVREEWRVSVVMTGRSLVNSLAAQDRSVDFYDLKAVFEQLCETVGVRGIRYQDLGSVAGEHSQFHPYQATKILLGPGACGVLGRIHPALEAKEKIRQPVYAFEVSLDRMLQLAKSDRKYTAIAKFPKVLRDYSLIVPVTMQSEKVVQTIIKIGKPIVESASVVDVYEGDKIPAGSRSVSIAMTWGDPNRTLEEQEIETVSQKILAGLDKELGVKLRLQ